MPSNLWIKVVSPPFTPTDLQCLVEWKGDSRAHRAIEHVVEAPGFYLGLLTDASDGRAHTCREQVEILVRLLGDGTRNTSFFRDALARVLLGPKFAGLLSANEFRALWWFLQSYDNQQVILVTL